MIFVTVGTHEQQFNRLIKKIDELKINGVICENVVIQTGYSDYRPQACEARDFYPYSQMITYTESSRIVITHGGPSSFLMALQMGKVPIVVPRRRKYNEHVNDHQVNFCRTVAERQGNIILVEDVHQLEGVIISYDSIVASMSNDGLQSNNEMFCRNFEKIVNSLME